MYRQAAIITVVEYCNQKISQYRTEIVQNKFGTEKFDDNARDANDHRLKFNIIFFEELKEYIDRLPPDDSDTKLQEELKKQNE